MSVFEKIFTDSIKDVIGNDPVVDQFDTVYNSSFFGTSQDDYITGSLLSVSRREGKFVFTEGTRGKAFSKYFSSIQPQLSYNFSSRDVSLIPQLSYRQVAWSDRVSKTSNRIAQCFDSKERYYDSCLPDLNYCLRQNNTRPWHLNTRFSLSPYGNVDVDNNAFMIFNSIPLNRSSEGFSNDPTVNNEWTWSYPYDPKYNPTRRMIKVEESLGIRYSDLKADWNFAISGSSYFSNWNINIENVTSLDKNSLISKKGIIPILPGKLDSTSISAHGGRNSLRGVFDQKSPYYTKLIYGIDSQLDNKLGVSLLVPSDVNLGKYADHSYLGGLSVSDPGYELLTGSMTLDDTIKFFFGFGDLNNMTYSRYNYEETSKQYEQDFEIGENIFYYFWGNAGSSDSPRVDTEDRALDRVQQTTTYTVSRSSGGGELGLSGWLSIGFNSSATTDTYWLTDSGDPNRTSIPAGTWTFRINCYGNTSGMQIKAEIYKLAGSTPTLLGTSEAKSIPVNMTYMRLDWNIASPISVLSTDRIAVKLLMYVPPSNYFINHIAYVNNRYSYFGFLLTRYSSLSTNMMNTYNPNTKYREAKDTPTYSLDDLTVRWNNSTSTMPWCTVYRSGSTTIDGAAYNFWGPAPLSGTVSPYKRGIFGLTDTNEDFILYASGSYDTSVQQFSRFCLDITSSSPWSISYDRAVAGPQEFSLISYIAGYPGVPSHLLPGGAFSSTELIDVVTGSNNDPGTTPSPSSPKFYFDTFKNFDSAYEYNGTAQNPTTFYPGEWRFVFSLSWDGITSNDFIMSGVDNIKIKTYSISGDIDGPKIGGNNYPQFRTYRVDPRKNETISITLTPTELTGSKQLHEANIFGVSPVIRGWKYGLINGLPTNSKAVFRRNRFGQFRDMLEQRQYTKFINVDDSPSDDDATTRSGFNKFTQSRLTRTIITNTVGPSVAEVGFFRQRYKKDERGIGFIYNESVSPNLTTSQNLSTEVTSSFPYFDGEARIRQESDLALITDATLTSLQIDTTGLTVV